jgi:hypothetical protein
VGEEVHGPILMLRWLAYLLFGLQKTLHHSRAYGYKLAWFLYPAVKYILTMRIS